MFCILYIKGPLVAQTQWQHKTFLLEEINQSVKERILIEMLHINDN